MPIPPLMMMVAPTVPLDIIRLCTDPNTASIVAINVLNTVCDVSRLRIDRLTDHVFMLVASAFQGSTPLKPADVAALVNHCDKVGYGDRHAVARYERGSMSADHKSLLVQLLLCTPQPPACGWQPPLNLWLTKSLQRTVPLLDEHMSASRTLHLSISSCVPCYASRLATLSARLCLSEHADRRLNIRYGLCSAGRQDMFDACSRV